MADRTIRWWGDLAPNEISDVARRDPVVVLPLAATEHHGPHLPLSTDVDIGLGLLAIAFLHLPEDAPVWVLDPVAVGASQEHKRFPGTRSVTSEELTGTIVQEGTALANLGIRRFVLSNSHGGNRSAMDVGGLRLRARSGLLVVKATYTKFGRPTEVQLPELEWRHGLHGGAIETAMMMYLRPERVRTDAVAAFPSLGEDLERTLSRLGPEGQASFSWLSDDLNPQGVVGDATLASAEMGGILVQHYGRALAEVILDARDFPLDRLSRGVET
jgi:creatinine amidohydrolase